MKNQKFTLSVLVFTCFVGTWNCLSKDKDVFFATSRGVSIIDGKVRVTDSNGHVRKYGHYQASVIDEGLFPIVHSSSSLSGVEKSLTSNYSSWIRAAKNSYPGRTKVLVYVHGFRNSFQDALNRSAILSEKMETVIPIVYSWPASKGVPASWKEAVKGILADYHHALDVEDESARDLALFLRSLGGTFGSRNVNVVAHSFGNSITLKALTEEAKNMKIRNVVMVAPDVPRSEFDKKRRQLEARTNRLSIYYAEDDLVLTGSSLRDSRRWGSGSLGNQTRGTLFNTKGKTDVIDSSYMGRTIGGHGYHTSNRRVRDDISNLIDRDSNANQRKTALKKVKNSSGNSWFTFKKKEFVKEAVARKVAVASKRPLAEAFGSLFK